MRTYGRNYAVYLYAIRANERQSARTFAGGRWSGGAPTFNDPIGCGLPSSVQTKEGGIEYSSLRSL